MLNIVDIGDRYSDIDYSNSEYALAAILELELNAPVTIINGQPLARYVVGTYTIYKGVDHPGDHSLTLAHTIMSISDCMPIGYWECDGLHYIDMVTSFNDLDHAMACAMSFNQLAIYDSVTDSVIDVK